jgi:cyclopropane-fatty-acyl-phospholipid synthase
MSSTERTGLPGLRLFDRERASLRLIESLARRLRCGRLHLTFPDGREIATAGERDGPQARLTIRNARFARKLLFGGALGFAEAYLDGDCETDDLVAVFELAAANEHAALGSTLRGGGATKLAARLLHRLRANSRRGAKRNIAAHYDLGNAFYALWLDASMTYSSAVFEHPAQDLESAQTAKYRRMAELAEIGPDHHVLEIGCGWGGFAAYAAGEIGCRVTAITISQAQHDFAAERIRAAGLQDRVAIRLIDYRDVEGTFDRIVSIEMIEAVGERWWPTYFARLRELLTAGGRAALQAITIEEASWDTYRRSVDYIQRYIFPGGMLPAPSVLHDRVREAGLAAVAERSHALDYAETLRRWRAAFEEAWPRIAAEGFDDRFRRMWRYYLAYCEAGFRAGRIDLRQVALTKA